MARTKHTTLRDIDKEETEEKNEGPSAKEIADHWFLHQKIYAEKECQDLAMIHPKLKAMVNKNAKMKQTIQRNAQGKPFFSQKYWIKEPRGDDDEEKVDPVSVVLEPIYGVYCDEWDEDVREKGSQIPLDPQWIQQGQFCCGTFFYRMLTSNRQQFSASEIESMASGIFEYDEEHATDVHFHMMDDENSMFGVLLCIASIGDLKEMIIWCYQMDWIPIISPQMYAYPMTCHAVRRALLETPVSLSFNAMTRKNIALKRRAIKSKIELTEFLDPEDYIGKQQTMHKCIGLSSELMVPQSSRLVNVRDDYEDDADKKEDLFDVAKMPSDLAAVVNLDDERKLILQLNAHYTSLEKLPPMDTDLIVYFHEHDHERKSTRGKGKGKGKGKDKGKNAKAPVYVPSQTMDQWGSDWRTPILSLDARLWPTEWKAIRGWLHQMTDCICNQSPLDSVQHMLRYHSLILDIAFAVENNGDTWSFLEECVWKWWDKHWRKTCSISNSRMTWANLACKDLDIPSLVYPPLINPERRGIRKMNAIPFKEEMRMALIDEYLTQPFIQRWLDPMWHNNYCDRIYDFRLYVSGRIKYFEDDLMDVAVEKRTDIWQAFSWGQPHGDGIRSFRDKMLAKEQVKGFVVVNRFTNQVLYGEDHLWFITPVVKPNGIDFTRLDVVCWTEILAIEEQPLLVALNMVQITRKSVQSLITRWIFDFVFDGEGLYSACQEKCSIQVFFGPATQSVFHTQFATIGGVDWNSAHRQTSPKIPFPIFLRRGHWLSKPAKCPKAFTEYSLCWPTLYVQRLISLDLFGQRMDETLIENMGLGFEMIHQLSMLYFWCSGDGMLPVRHYPRSVKSVDARADAMWNAKPWGPEEFGEADEEEKESEEDEADKESE